VSEIFIDTNVILRFLLKDNKTYYVKAESLFLEAKDKKQAIRLIPQVVFEVVYVLEKLYKVERADIAGAMRVFLEENFIKTINKKELFCALDLYSSNKSLSLVDIYLSCHAKKAQGELVTFDTKLKKFHEEKR